MDITLSQAIEGYMIHAEARQLAPGTMADYTNTFQLPSLRPLKAT
jgi:hypothetical protein